MKITPSNLIYSAAIIRGRRLLQFTILPCGDYSRAAIIQGRRLIEEIRYF